MLFGWADRQAGFGNAYWAPRNGLYRQNGGYGADALAPVNQDGGVENVIREIHGYVGTFCIFGSGATWPWSMADAWRYLPGRSYTSLRAGWNSIGWSQDWIRDRARDSIKYRATPAVIGTGWLQPLPDGVWLRIPGAHGPVLLHLVLGRDGLRSLVLRRPGLGRVRQRVGLRQHVVRRGDLPVGRTPPYPPDPVICPQDEGNAKCRT